MSIESFAERLVAWQKTHGRHDLPWQNTRDPYAIWVSEIMLQQTQVAAVIGYYQRFMRRFPDIVSLASAEQDEVMQHWSGLGYYSRARNLHAAAQKVVDEHAGVFPQDVALIEALPGIGRSTAAAIASFAFGQSQAILDGNVKRVFARHFLIEGWPGSPKVEKQLWTLAEQLLPTTGMEAYTQGLMDLGATLCTRSKPRCDECPLQASCLAFKQRLTAELPVAKPRKATPQKQTTMLILLRGDEVLLEKRPPAGIWGGLWSLPQADGQSGLEAHARQHYGVEAEAMPALPSLQHAFTHFRLQIRPQPLRVLHTDTQARQANIVWLPLTEAIGAAIPTPVRRILQSLK